jgi:hypothetical protein
MENQKNTRERSSRLIQTLFDFRMVDSVRFLTDKEYAIRELTEIYQADNIVKKELAAMSLLGPDNI